MEVIDALSNSNPQTKIWKIDLRKRGRRLISYLGSSTTSSVGFPSGAHTHENPFLGKTILDHVYEDPNLSRTLGYLKVIQHDQTRIIKT